MLNKVLTFLKNIFKFHKLKLLSVFIFFILFLFLVFPFDDLSDVLTNQVVKLTNNKVYLEFEELDLSLFPVVGLRLTDVKVDASGFPTFSASSLKISPAIGALLTFKPGASVDAEDFLGGDLDLKVVAGDKVKKDKPERVQKVDLQFTEASLNQILPLLMPSLSGDGNLNLDVQGQVDPLFTQQPELELQANSSKFHLRPLVIQAGPGMSFSVPELKFRQIDIKGRLVGSKLVIEKGELGSPKDPIYIKLKGQINLELRQSRTGLSPRWGSFDLQTDINVDRSQEKELIFKTLNAFYSRTKVATAKGSRYLMKISGSSFMSPPNVRKSEAF